MLSLKESVQCRTHSSSGIEHPSTIVSRSLMLQLSPGVIGREAGRGQVICPLQDNTETPNDESTH